MLRRRFALAAVVRLPAVLLLGTWFGPSAAADVPRVDVPTARAATERGHAVLIDIREPDEHAQGVAPWARRLPLSQIGERIGEIPRDADQPVLLICRTQNRSGKLAQALRERGYGNVSFVDGGMKEWQQRGYPMVAPDAAAR